MDLPESATAGSSERGQTARAKASTVTMLGLAISMGAAGALIPSASASARDDAGSAVAALPSFTADSSAAASSPQRITITHIVRERETLWSVAQRYRVRPDDIARINGIDGDSLRVGQSIKVAVASQAKRPLAKAVPSAPAPMPLSPQTASSSPNLAQIQVQQAIPRAIEASRDDADAKLSDSQKKEANLLASPRVGKALVSQGATAETPQPANEVVSAPSSTAAFDGATLAQVLAETAQANAESAPTPENDSTDHSQDQQGSQYSVATSSTWSPLTTGASSARPTSHTIRVGETISSIARDYGISRQELVELNGIRNPNRVFVGQTLTLPAIEPTRAVSMPEAATFAPEETVQVAAALPIPLPAAEATHLPEAVRNSAQPQDQLPSQGEEHSSLGDQPESSAADSQSDVATDAPSIDRAVDTAPNRYAEDLMNDIQVMAEDGDPVAVDETSEDDAILMTSAAVPSDRASLDEEDINPDFAATASASVQTSRQATPVPATAAVSQPASSEQSSDALVASAPLGSENYVPLSEPVTGRMVSPELPPLSDPEHHLPTVPMPFNGYLWPARGILTSGYGWRWGRMHQGIDVAAPVGTPIVAAAPGVVEFSGWNSGGYGNMVDIRHPDGNKTRYAHNSRNLVRVGQKVTQGQQIAEMGSTGYSTGPHVHFEIHLPNQGAVNPTALLPAR